VVASSLYAAWYWRGRQSVEAVFIIMSFLVWENESDCKTSLDKINHEYGFPYVLSNGYSAAEWDVMTKSDAEEKWGFYAPETRLRKNGDIVTEEFLMTQLEGSFEQGDRLDDWISVDPLI